MSFTIPSGFAHLVKKLPNIKSTRTHAVIKRALKWSIDHMDKKVVSLHNDEIIGALGDYSEGTAKHVFNLLFTRDPDSKYVNPYFAKNVDGSRKQGVCYSYFPHVEGWMLLDASLKAKKWVLPKDIEADVEAFYQSAHKKLRGYLTMKHSRELARGQWKYKHEDELGRLTHSLQQVQRHIRSEWWIQHGYLFEYDIQAAMATLFFQLGVEHGLEAQLPTFKAYVADRKALRNELVILLNAHVDDVKAALASIINGGRLNASSHCAVGKTLGLRAAKLFVSHPSVIALHAESKLITKLIETNSTAKNAAVWYQQEERKIMDITREIFAAEGIDLFSMHDGAYVKLMNADLEEKVKAEVADKLGWRIELDWDMVPVIIESVDSYQVRAMKWLKSAFESIVGEDWETGQKL